LVINGDITVVSQAGGEVAVLISEIIAVCTPAREASVITWERASIVRIVVSKRREESNFSANFTSTKSQSKSKTGVKSSTT
jgi:hypothetical protein